MTRSHVCAVVLAACLSACASTPAIVDREPDQHGGADPLLAHARVPHVVVAEAFLTPMTPDDNVDSPALWLDGEGRAVLLATAKASGRLMRYDGDTGAAAGVVGEKGSGPGQFDRPNGIFVADDLVFVVERDNRRVQVLRLPAMAPVGSFGQEELQQPYGIWLRSAGARRYEVLVSDAYMDGEDARGEDILPPLDQLDRRLRRYQVEVRGGALHAKPAGNVGDTGQAGAIRIPESVWGDPTHDRLLVAEEDTAVGTSVRVYNLSGRYQGSDIGRGVFKAQAEGIALWQCGEEGYWITTDQFNDRSLFHVWDRRSLRHVGAFAGNTVANTDGVWLHQGATARFPLGVFYAVHDDMGVGAFDWRDISRALDLPACGEER